MKKSIPKTQLVGVVRKLDDSNLASEKILSATDGKSYVQIREIFLTAVETVPVEKETELPKEVQEAYNFFVELESTEVTPPPSVPPPSVPPTPTTKVTDKRPGPPRKVCHFIREIICISPNDTKKGISEKVAMARIPCSLSTMDAVYSDTHDVLRILSKLGMLNVEVKDEQKKG